MTQYIIFSLLAALLLSLTAKAGVQNMFRSKPYPEAFFSGELLAVAKAIKNKDIEKAKLLAEQLPDIDAPGTENFTLLAFAVADTNTQAIQMLIGLGADPAAQIHTSVSLQTVAGFAMWRKTTEALKAMLEAGMEPNIAVKGRTLIFGVPNLEDNDSLKLLIEFGADVNAKDSLGQTALFKFINVQFDEALYILGHGADPFVMDHSGMTAAYTVQENLNNMDKATEAYQKMLKIQQKMISMGVQFPALTPFGERYRLDIVWCDDPEDYLPRSECKIVGVNEYHSPQSEESKRADEKILLERYGIKTKL